MNLEGKAQRNGMEESQLGKAVLTPAEGICRQVILAVTDVPVHVTTDTRAKQYPK